TIALVQQALAMVRRPSASVRIVSYRDLFIQAVALDPFLSDEAQLRAGLGEVGIQPDGLTRDDWLDLLMSHRIQSQFAVDAITVIHDWPASQAALAKIRPGAPPLAERFELYLGPVELANGYHELNDAVEQRQRFERDLAIRAARGAEQPPLDEAFLAALPSLPACAGVAVGVDRLLMALAGTPRIGDV
ncbi:MAG: amino acid--tRNA ligase-related protein, partial [Stenotrophomonas sp.]